MKQWVCAWLLKCDDLGYSKSGLAIVVWRLPARGFSEVASGFMSLEGEYLDTLFQTVASDPSS